jgi:4-amino-4-deoxy-L-arabinose transferase-like glycosyltransferase
MGQSILDGHLPYIELWDNKPPFLFFIFAIIITICGKKIVFIRIIGSLFVSISAFFIYQSGKYLGTINTGLISAILFIIMTGEMGGKSVMSEIVASVPLTAAFLVMIRQKENSHIISHFLLGFLLSIATLIRLNLAYLDAFIFLYYTFLCFFKKKLKSLINLCILTFGILIPMIIITIPYILTGNFLIFYKSVIEAPFSYSTSQLSKLVVISYFIKKGLLEGNLISCLFWIGFFLGFVIVLYRIDFSTSWIKYETNRNLILLLLWVIVIAFSIASSGHTYPHYLIQILPFMAIIKSIFLSSGVFYKYKYILFIFFIIGLLDSTKNIVDRYVLLFIQSKNGLYLQNDEGYRIAKFLKKANPQKKAIYMMDLQIVYWLTDTKPITKMITHPSNIGEDSLLKIVVNKDATAENEMRNILNSKPLFIIKSKEVPYLKNKPEAMSLLSIVIRQEYKLINRVGDFYIYKKK